MSRQNARYGAVVAPVTAIFTTFTAGAAIGQPVDREKPSFGPIPRELDLSAGLFILLACVVMFVVTGKINRVYFGWANRVFPPIVFKVVILLNIAFLVIGVLLIAAYLMQRIGEQIDHD